jgi:hypothetical protein
MNRIIGIFLVLAAFGCAPKAAPEVAPEPPPAVRVTVRPDASIPLGAPVLAPMLQSYLIAQKNRLGAVNQFRIVSLYLEHNRRADGADWPRSVSMQLEALTDGVVVDKFAVLVIDPPPDANGTAQKIAEKILEHFVPPKIETLPPLRGRSVFFISDVELARSGHRSQSVRGPLR